VNLDLSPEQLSRFSDFIEEQLGLYFPPPRQLDLRRGTAAAAQEFGFEDVSECMRWLMSAPLTDEQSGILAGHLTVGETYFFREPKTFEILADHVLPALIRSRRGERRLRLWSAACCTGEEAYSLAILLRQTLRDIDDWNVTILATDLNPNFLRKAATGSYGNWSFRDTPGWIKHHYFSKTAAGDFEIVPEIRRMVRFARLNLVEDVYPSAAKDIHAMDLIFCRNVLMYFSARQVAKVIQKLYRAQTDSGWLIVSPSESSHVLFRPYVTIDFPGVILHQKDSGRAPGLEPCSAAPHEAPVFNAPAQAPVLELPEAALVEPQEPPPVSHQVSHAPATEPALTPYDEAVALFSQRCYAEAADRLEKLASSPATPSQVFHLLARALANQGKLADALGWSDYGIAADKLNPASYYLRALVLQEQGAMEDAAASLRRALYVDQNFVLAHFALGNIARSAGKAQEAEKHLKNALQILRSYQEDDILSESEGITAGRLREIITSLISQETGT
jgi:chemotaxis protein methyltransferase CheR